MVLRNAPRASLAGGYRTPIIDFRPRMFAVCMGGALLYWVLSKHLDFGICSKAHHENNINNVEHQGGTTTSSSSRLLLYIQYFCCCTDYSVLLLLYFVTTGIPAVCWSRLRLPKCVTRNYSTHTCFLNIDRMSVLVPGDGDSPLQGTALFVRIGPRIVRIGRELLCILL